MFLAHEKGPCQCLQCRIEAVTPLLLLVEARVLGSVERFTRPQRHCGRDMGQCESGHGLQYCGQRDALANAIIATSKKQGVSGEKVGMVGDGVILVVILWRRARVEAPSATSQGRHLRGLLFRSSI